MLKDVLKLGKALANLSKEERYGVLSLANSLAGDVKVGRKKKSPPVAAVVSEAPKKKRGRPRKNPLPVEAQ